MGQTVCCGSYSPPPDSHRLYASIPVMHDEAPTHGSAGLAPESTALRVALWRALHAQIDPPPHVLEDEVGLQLVAPEEGWRRRPDMDPQFTKPFRASIVARARFIEDLRSSGFDPGRAAVVASTGVSMYLSRDAVASTMRRIAARTKRFVPVSSAPRKERERVGRRSSASSHRHRS